MQGLGCVTGQIDFTEKVAARDDAYSLQGDVCCTGLDLGNFPKAYTGAMQTCNMLHWHSNCCQHQVYDLKKSNVCRTSLLYSRKFSSAKISSKRPSGSSSGIYFRQVPVFTHLLFDRSVVARLLIVYLPIHESISYSTHVVIEKLVRNLI